MQEKITFNTGSLVLTLNQYNDRYEPIHKQGCKDPATMITYNAWTLIPDRSTKQSDAKHWVEWLLLCVD